MDGLRKRLTALALCAVIAFVGDHFIRQAFAQGSITARAVNNVFHLHGVSATPAVTACGDGVITAGSSDTFGAVTGTTQTGCTVNFSSAYSTVSICVMENITTNGVGRVAATATSNFSVTGLTAGDDFMYICGSLR